MLKEEKAINDTVNSTLSMTDWEHVISILEESYHKSPSPSVTLISNTEKTPYHILVSTLISLRTKDEVTLKASRNLFTKAGSCKEILLLPEDEIAGLLYPAGFYKTKAKRLLEIARIIEDEYEGEIPDSMDKLLRLPGVGRKTANLVLILGFKQSSICVDTHVHRLSNRFGWVKTSTPDQTEFALKDLVPEKYWIMLNDFMVSYGQMVCKPVSPLCSTCKLLSCCPKIGVTRHR